MATECADYIFYGGTTITMEYVAGPLTQFVHLNDRQTLLPGFIEPHSHTITMAILKSVSAFKSFY